MCSVDMILWYFMTVVLCLQCLINIDYLRVEWAKLESYLRRMPRRQLKPLWPEDIIQPWSKLSLLCNGQNTDWSAILSSGDGSTARNSTAFYGVIIKKVKKILTMYKNYFLAITICLEDVFE